MLLLLSSGGGYSQLTPTTSPPLSLHPSSSLSTLITLRSSDHSVKPSLHQPTLLPRRHRGGHPLCLLTIRCTTATQGSCLTRTPVPSTPTALPRGTAPQAPAPPPPSPPLLARGWVRAVLARMLGGDGTTSVTTPVVARCTQRALT